MNLNRLGDHCYCLSFGSGGKWHNIYFNAVGLPVKYDGPCGDVPKQHPNCDDILYAILRDAVASVGVELLRQKLNGEPA
jgi:hypothetical protein